MRGGRIDERREVPKSAHEVTSINRDKNYCFPVKIISHLTTLKYRRELRQRFHTWQEITSLSTVAYE